MKSRFPLLPSRRNLPFAPTIGLLLVSQFLLAPCVIRAQLVADGGTNILDGFATNVIGNLVVGDIGSFTVLALTNGATLTNTGSAVIGTNTTASSNSVIVAGAGSIWQCLGGITVGARGSFNNLSINGGTLTNEFCYVGAAISSSNNSVNVAGAGSLFASHQGIVVGAGGFFHQLTVSNGGRVWVGSSDSDVAGQSIIKVTGPASQWKGEGINNLLDIGGRGVGETSLSNSLTVADGGRMENVTFWMGVTGGGAGNVLITDPGSYFTNLSATVDGLFNRLIVSNGAVMAALGISVRGSSNAVFVTGPGSLCTSSVQFGISGRSVQVWVRNGGNLVSGSSYIGGTPSLVTSLRPTNNTFTVTGPSSLWLNQSNLWIGFDGGFNQVVVSNAGMMVTENAYFGGNYGFSRSNTAIITGSGSTWVNRRELQVGNAEGYQQVILTNGGTLSTSNLILGFSANAISNRVQLDDGNLTVTNAALTGTADVRRGTAVLNSGLFQTDFLKAANGVNSQIQFSGGILKTRGTAITNGAPFVVGDGSRNATFELFGGTHSFADGLTISSNALLTGNGTIAGDVSVSAGGMLSPGSLIGQLAIEGNLVLGDGSSTLIELNAGAQTNDSFSGLTSVVYSGKLVLTNLTGTLSNGNAFRLFVADEYSGTFSSIAPSTPGLGLKWNLNQLPIDGTLRIVNASTAQPVIASATLSTGDLVIAVTKGVPYDPVYLLTSTNLTAPLSNWEVCKTNQFTMQGSTTFTNPVTPNEPARYFRMRVD